MFLIDFYQLLRGFLVNIVLAIKLFLIRILKKKKIFFQSLNFAMINPVRILSDVQLKKLKEHKYSSSCQSLLDPAMQIFWNW